jgi:hypothetical protein
MLRLALSLGLALGLTAPALADCASDIKDIVARSISSGPFSVDTTVDSSAVDTVMHAEMVPPDAFHTIATIDGKTFETIAVDGRSYVNNSGSWSELPPASNIDAADVFSNEALRSIATMRDTQCLGSETIDGQTYLVFGFGFRSDMVTSTTRLLVDPTSRLPARTETSMSMSGIAADSVSIYTYDPTITVTAPEF